MLNNFSPVAGGCCGYKGSALYGGGKSNWTLFPLLLGWAIFSETNGF